MKYRINMVGTWLPFLVLLPLPMMLISMLKLSNFYAMIFTGIDVVYFVCLLIWVLRLSRNFRVLIMENGALVFSKCTIPTEEIKKVIVNQRTGVMTLYRKGHKIPLVIGVRLPDKVYFLSEMETWLRGNKVTISVVSVRKRLLVK
jgi:hypothetical protein